MILWFFMFLGISGRRIKKEGRKDGRLGRMVSVGGHLHIYTYMCVSLFVGFRTAFTGDGR